MTGIPEMPGMDMRHMGTPGMRMAGNGGPSAGASPKPAGMNMKMSGMIRPGLHSLSGLVASGLLVVFAVSAVAALRGLMRRDNVNRRAHVGHLVMSAGMVWMLAQPAWGRTSVREDLSLRSV
jgi:hypothetical protein